MKIGRNDPCPCGSGKKYKKCCLLEDRKRRRSAPSPATPASSGSPALSPATKGQIRQATTWQAGFLPLPAPVSSEPESRPTVVLITASGFVVRCEFLDRPSVEVEDLATELNRQLENAAKEVGRGPRQLRVDDDELARALRGRIGPSLRPILVEHGAVPEVFGAWASMAESLLGERPEEPATAVLTWAAWDQGDGWNRAMHEILVRFYRAAPWRVFGEGESIAVEDRKTGGQSIVSVSSDDGPGLMLMIEKDSPPVDTPRMGLPLAEEKAYEMLAIFFYRRAEAPPQALQEINRKQLRVPNRNAIPMLNTIGTRAGGLPRDRADLLLRTIRAMVELFEEHRDEAAEQIAGTAWRSAENEILLYREGGVAADWPEVDVENPEPLGARGSAADPEACFPFLDVSDDAIFEIAPYLDEMEELLRAEGLSERTIRVHMENVTYFLDYLAEWAMVRPEAFHAYDLQGFLYDWYSRKTAATETEARSVRVSVRRFLEHLEKTTDLRFPWAWDILSDQETFERRWETCPGGPFWSADVADWTSALNWYQNQLVLLPDSQLDEDLEWAATMGLREAELWEELQRRWLRWRDEELEKRSLATNELFLALRKRQRSWAESPHPAHDGKTPIEVIRAERET